MTQSVRLTIPRVVAEDWWPKYEDIAAAGVDADPSYPPYVKVEQAMRGGRVVRIDATEADLREFAAECDFMLDRGCEVNDDPEQRNLKRGFQRLRAAVNAARAGKEEWR